MVGSAIVVAHDIGELGRLRGPEFRSREPATGAVCRRGRAFSPGLMLESNSAEARNTSLHSASSGRSQSAARAKARVRARCSAWRV